MVNTLSLGVVAMAIGSALAGYAPPPAPSTVVVNEYYSSMAVVSVAIISTVPCSEKPVAPAKPTTMVTPPSNFTAPGGVKPTTVLPVFHSGASQSGVATAVGVLAFSVFLGMLL
jgi:hypothetical protein